MRLYICPKLWRADFKTRIGLKRIVVQYGLYSQGWLVSLMDGTQILTLRMLNTSKV